MRECSSRLRRRCHHAIPTLSCRRRPFLFTRARCRVQAPPILQDCYAFTRQKQALTDFEEQGREWRHKKFMPDPVLQAALERVNQMERDNPMPFRPLREL